MRSLCGAADAAHVRSAFPRNGPGTRSRLIRSSTSMVMSGVPPPMVEALRRVRRRLCGTRLWTCCAGRAGTRIRSEALQRMLSIGRPVAHRAGARPYQLTFILDSSELLGTFAYNCRRQRLEPPLTAAGSKGWSLRLQLQEAKAGAFAYNCRRQRLEPSLTTAGSKGWSLRLQLQEAKAGAFAYNCRRQRLEPSLTIVY